MEKRISQILLVALLLAIRVSFSLSQTSSELQTSLSQKIGLKQEQIAAIENGQPFAKNMEQRSPAEMFCSCARLTNVGVAKRQRDSKLSSESRVKCDSRAYSSLSTVIPRYNIFARTGQLVSPRSRP